jgi:hypothetical protein
MTVTGAARTALWQAIEDYSGLWELLWELKTQRPEVDDRQLRSEASAAVADLVLRGLIDLYRCQEPYGQLSKIATEEITTVLAEDAVWAEPEKGGISVRMGATQAGEETYKE